MYATVTKKIDELGRVVLPHTARNTMNLSAKDAVKISWDGEKIVIMKARSACKLCGSETELNEKFGVCQSCIDRITSK